MVLSLSDSLSGVVGLLAKGTALPKGPYIIVACTNFENPDQAIERYSQSYWKGIDPEVLRGILKTIWPHLIQPRTMPHFEETYQHLSNGGEWVELRGGKASEVWETLAARNEGANPYEDWHAQLQLEATVMLKADNGVWQT